MTLKAKSEEPIFSNNFVQCYSDHLVIDLYYFPYGSKTVQYKDIQSCQLLKIKDLGIFKWKTWGMALSSIWWHADVHRFSREYCIILDTNHWPQIGLTMDDNDINTVYHLIQQKIDQNRSTKIGPEKELS